MYIVETDAGYKYIYNNKASKISFKTKKEALQALILVTNV
jgi:hypothetical protein